MNSKRPSFQHRTRYSAFSPATAVPSASGIRASTTWPPRIAIDAGAGSVSKEIFRLPLRWFIWKICRRSAIEICESLPSISVSLRISPKRALRSRIASTWSSTSASCQGATTVASRESIEIGASSSSFTRKMKLVPRVRGFPRRISASRTPSITARSIGQITASGMRSSESSSAVAPCWATSTMWPRPVHASAMPLARPRSWSATSRRI
jgi:hypothetical protein